jgi:hypothetical protein
MDAAAANNATANAIATAITNALANMQPPAAQVVQLQAPAAVAPVAHVPVWTRTPALTGATILDYQANTSDAKIFKDNTAKLDTTFSLAKPNVTALITELVIRAETSSWNGLMTMVINAVNLNFLKSYGRVTLPELHAHVNTFIDTPTHVSQNDYQLYVCLTRSVDVATKETMENEQALYHAGTVIPANAVEPDLYPSGLLYAKVLLTKAQADSQATITHARSNLIALDQYMARLPNSDVKEFNDYVKCQLQTLTARGETTNNLILFLFRGYMMAKCPTFIDFITRKEEGYTADGVAYTPESLMSMAEKYYEILKLKGTWTATTPRDEQVLALTAEIAALKEGRKPKKEKDRNTFKSKMSPSERFTGEQAWKAVTPKNGEAHSKPVRKLIFHWCPHHGFWTAHKPEDCTLGATELVDASSKPTTKPPPTAVTKKLTFAQAMAAIVDEEDEETSDA